MPVNNLYNAHSQRHFLKIFLVLTVGPRFIYVYAITMQYIGKYKLQLAYGEYIILTEWQTECSSSWPHLRCDQPHLSAECITFCSYLDYQVMCPVK